MRFVLLIVLSSCQFPTFAQKPAAPPSIRVQDVTLVLPVAAAIEPFDPALDYHARILEEGLDLFTRFIARSRLRRDVTLNVPGWKALVGLSILINQHRYRPTDSASDPDFESMRELVEWQRTRQRTETPATILFENLYYPHFDVTSRRQAFVAESLANLGAGSLPEVRDWLDSQLANVPDEVFTPPPLRTNHWIGVRGAGPVGFTIFQPVAGCGEEFTGKGPTPDLK